MIRLTIPKDPYWIDLPHGVRVFVRPLTTAVYEAARARGWRMARAISAEHADLKAAGADITGLPDLSDEDTLAGLSQMLFAQGLARSAITKWEGVLDEADQPAEVTDTSIAELMQLPRMAESFVVQYTETHEAVIAEGNVSRPAPNGTSAAGRNTAEAALGPATAPMTALQKAGIITTGESRALLEGFQSTAIALGASSEQLEQSLFGLAQGLALLHAV